MSADFKRSDDAAANVSPKILADALDHIARTAANSRSLPRRIRWIQARAEGALAGDPNAADSLDLPKSAGPDTPERLQKRIEHLKRMNGELLAALQGLLDVCTCAFAGPEDRQHANFETYFDGKLVEAPKAMQDAKLAISRATQPDSVDLTGSGEAA